MALLIMDLKDFFSLCQQPHNASSHETLCLFSTQVDRKDIEERVLQTLKKFEKLSPEKVRCLDILIIFCRQ